MDSANAVGSSDGSNKCGGIPIDSLQPHPSSLLRILDKKDKMPRLPQVEYVLRSRDVDTRSTISALGTLIQEMATQVTIGGAVERR
jgi:hypothetical protein